MSVSHDELAIGRHMERIEVMRFLANIPLDGRDFRNLSRERSVHHSMVGDLTVVLISLPQPVNDAILRRRPFQAHHFNKRLLNTLLIGVEVKNLSKLLEVTPRGGKLRHRHKCRCRVW